jgi:hypothetical protein
MSNPILSAAVAARKYSTKKRSGIPIIYAATSGLFLPHD